jgi:hypothetical protein
MAISLLHVCMHLCIGASFIHSLVSISPPDFFIMGDVYTCECLLLSMFTNSGMYRGVNSVGELVGYGMLNFAVELYAYPFRMSFTYHCIEDNAYKW